MDIIKTKVETLVHILEVRNYLEIFVKELLNRGINHDASKLVSPELEGFAENTDKLKQVNYGTEEYKALLEELKPTLDHHYAHNSHHPQFYENGIDGMNLLDIVECFCDWKAATLRMKNGDMNKSIEVNEKRFNMSPQLVNIFKNTLKVIS